MTKITEKEEKGNGYGDVKRLRRVEDGMSTTSFVFKVLVERGGGEGRAGGDVVNIGSQILVQGKRIV